VFNLLVGNADGTAIGLGMPRRSVDRAPEQFIERQ
jgi:hypothetical protein